VGEGGAARRLLLMEKREGEAPGSTGVCLLRVVLGAASGSNSSRALTEQPARRSN
jgi:hypothetical protein